jgi:signal peptidase I
LLSARKKLIVVLLVISLVSATAAVLVYLQTPSPSNVLEITSGSMCVTYDGNCPGRLSPSEPTLHIGDFITFEEVNPRDLKTDYPDSDIIVFHKPGDEEELIVHRIVATEERNGVLYFYTKGDGNGYNKWPATPERSEYDPWNGGQGVPEDSVVGKVTNYDLSFLYRDNFWIVLIGVSALTAIGALLLFVLYLLMQRRNQRIEELEERIATLEAEKEK